VALSDYPSFAVNWEPGLDSQMLRALGKLAVTSSQAEELLHQIYWNHAKLSKRNGPIVTDNLNPKRLEEDIKKLVRLDKRKANILADLEILFKEFEALNTKRNHCLHWIWEAKHEDATVTVNDWPNKSAPYRLNRPLYKQSGELTEIFTVEDVKAYCDQYSWLSYRLRSHTFTDKQLRKQRLKFANQAPLNGMSVADLFWPAPWLDKPLPPVTKPSNPRGKKKRPHRRPRASRSKS
jgi:hypothetical protein